MMTAAKALLEANDLVLTREKKEQSIRVLDRVSLSLGRGDRVLLKGRSGAGKSTLLLALARMLPLDGGALSFQGIPSTEWEAPLWRKEVALVLQKPSLFAGTVMDNLLLPFTLKGSRGIAAPDKALLQTEMEKAGLAEVPLSSEAKKLSTGQAARVSVLRTLLTRPACLLLDEPFAALDPESAALVRTRLEAFAEGGGAVLMAGHMDRLSDAWRPVRLEQGRLVEAGP